MLFTPYNVRLIKYMVCSRTVPLPIALRLVVRRIYWAISNLVASVLFSIIVGAFWYLPIAIA